MKSNLNTIMIVIVLLLVILFIIGTPHFMQEIRNRKPINAELKKISGLNCSELIAYFENGRNCSGMSPHLYCAYPKSNRQNILYMMIVKSCSA